MSPLLFAWFVPLAYAAPAEQSLNHHLEQAQHFLRRGWFDDAEQEYQTGLAAVGGPASLELHQVGAQIAWQRLDVESAMLRTQAVAALATDPAQARAARSTAEGYARDFGFIDVVGPVSGVRVALAVESRGILLDPELAQYGQRLQQRYSEPVELPARLALPVGIWVINGHEIQVQAGSESRLELPSTGLGNRALRAIKSSQIELYGGLNLWSGPEVENLRPAPSIDLAWTQPMGPILVSFTSSIAGSRAQSSTGSIVRPGPDFGGGISFGHEFTNPTPLRLRFSAGARAQQVSGVQLHCEPGPTEWICSTPKGDDSSDTAVLSEGQAILPGASLSVVYHPEGTHTAMGSGIRISLDHARGHTPSQGTDRLNGLGRPLQEWTADETGFQGWQIRVQTALILAF